MAYFVFFFPVPSISMFLYFFLNMLIWLFHLVHKLMFFLSEGVEVCFALLLVFVTIQVKRGLVHAAVRILIHLVLASDIFRRAILAHEYFLWLFHIMLIMKWTCNLKKNLKSGLTLIFANGKVIMNVEVWENGCLVMISWKKWPQTGWTWT